MSESGSTISISAARFLMLPQAVLPPDTVLRWPTKAPAAVAAYTLDITPWLEDITDTLASFTAVVNTSNAPGLDIQSQQITGQNLTAMTVTLSGGVTGNEYSITFTATSAGGSVDAWTVWIYVQNIGATLARQQPTTIGPAGQGFTSRGAWAPNTQYNPYDVLTYYGTVYECVTAFTSGSTFDASHLTMWVTPPFGLQNPKVLGSPFSIQPDSNSILVGPVQVAPEYTIDVPSSSNLRIM